VDNQNIALLPDSGAVTDFNPKHTKEKVNKLDAFIKYSAKIREWPLLENAVDVKIAEQVEFVAWWDENVGVRESPGRAGVKSNAGLRSIPTNTAEVNSGIRQQQVSRWRKRLEDPEKYRNKMIHGARNAAYTAENHLAEGTRDNEWYTPAQYIEAAREVMGGIDLDPASNEHAQKWIKATKFYTVDDNALAQKWTGNVWLNPPFSRDLINFFVDKLIGELSAGNVDQAILLTHSYTDTKWFHDAESIAQSICFTRGRIKFIDQDGDTCAPTQGQAFFYYGTDRTSIFNTVFQTFGFIR